MECRWAVLVLLTAICGSTGPMSAQAQDGPRGAALLAQARTAVGGEARLEAVKTLDVRGDFKRAAGPMSAEGELQIRLERPDKLRRDEDISLPGSGPAIVRTEVLNGSTVWDENSGRRGFIGGFGRGDGTRGGGGARGSGRAAPDPALLEEAERRARRADLARFLLAWLLSTDAAVAWVGTAEAPDGRADVLEVTPGAGPTVRLFLDESTHLPLMMSWQGAAPLIGGGGRRAGRGAAAGDDPPPAQRPEGAPQPATFSMTLGEYKTVDGIRLPHLITRAVNGTTIEEWTIDSYRINPSFRADVFTQ